MTELSFLLELLLEHTLEKITQTLIRERIKEIEQAKTTYANMPTTIRNHVVATEAAVIAPALSHMPPVPTEATVIAHTPAAAKAMADRQQMIQQAISGRPEPGRTSPRKIGRP